MVLFYTNSHFQCISVLFERISLIIFFSLVLPRGVGLWSFFAREFLPRGSRFCSLFGPGVGISPPKKIPRGSARGDVNSWNWLIHKILFFRVSQNKGIDKRFDSDLLITLIHSFLISLDSVDL